jgi:hypothetical protein
MGILGLSNTLNMAQKIPYSNSFMALGPKKFNMQGGRDIWKNPIRY